MAAAAETLPRKVMAGLEHELAMFRHRLWWQHLSAHGVPNQILTAFHRQHRLPERFNQILAGVQDFNQAPREEAKETTDSSAVLFTVITVPVGIGVAMLQLWAGHFEALQFALVIAGCLAFSLLLLLTRPGRTAIHAVWRRLAS